jgi:GAF domain-containing protein
MEPAPFTLSRRASQTEDQPISYFMQQAVENPGLISLAAGLVDPGSLPAAEVAEALDAILARPETAQAALQYGTTQGYAPLRERLLQRTAALDGVTPGELGLTADELAAHVPGTALAWLAAPFTALDGRQVGALHAFRVEPEFSELDEAIVAQLAQMASATFERMQAYRR